MPHGQPSRDHRGVQEIKGRAGIAPSPPRKAASTGCRRQPGEVSARRQPWKGGVCDIERHDLDQSSLFQFLPGAYVNSPTPLVRGNLELDSSAQEPTAQVQFPGDLGRGRRPGPFTGLTSRPFPSDSPPLFTPTAELPIPPAPFRTGRCLIIPILNSSRLRVSTELDTIPSVSRFSYRLRQGVLSRRA